MGFISSLIAIGTAIGAGLAATVGTTGALAISYGITAAEFAAMGFGGIAVGKKVLGDAREPSTPPPPARIPRTLLDGGPGETAERARARLARRRSRSVFTRGLLSEADIFQPRLGGVSRLGD